MSMTLVYTKERAAIHALRDRFPTAKAKKLARQISDRQFSYSDNLKLANESGPRTTLSVYSVIRRYDAKNRVQQHQA